MAGFGDINLNLLVQKDTYEKIGFYILICCEEMKADLGKSKSGRKLPNDENRIRNYLLENYLDDISNRRKHSMTMFHFIPEGQENYDDNLLSYKGRVDIKIVSQNEWFENVKKIELIQQSNSDIDNICGLVRNGSGTIFVYDCKYKMYGKVLELKHMFVDFSGVIGKRNHG